MPRGRPRKNAASSPAAIPGARRRRTSNRPQVPFAYKLVLNQWLLSLFNVKRFGDLAEHLYLELERFKAERGWFNPNFLCVKESPDEGYYRILLKKLGS